MKREIKQDVDILALFEGLTFQQVRKLRECTLSILPPLRAAVVKSFPDEARRENTEEKDD